MPNGSIITSTLLRGEDPDTGLRTMLQTNVDGSSIETDEDGIVTQVTPDGTRITVHEDGSMVQTSADGERLFKRKDGTIERSCVTEAGGLSAGEDSESDRALALGDVDDAATPVVAASSYSSRRRSTFLTRVDSAPCSSASAAKAKGATAKLTRENEELAFALDAKTSALREVKRKLRRLEKKEELRKRIELETKSGADEARGDRVLKSKLKAIEARFENARETINEKERRIAQLEALQAELRRTAETTRSASGSDDTIECSEAVATDTARSPLISRTSASSAFRIFAQAPEPSALQLLRAAHARSEAESLAPMEVSTIAIAIAALSAGERASSESESSSSRSSISSDNGSSIALRVLRSKLFLWAEIAKFCNARVAICLASTCVLLRRGMINGKGYSLLLWKQQLVRLTATLFGASKVSEVDGLLDEEPTTLGGRRNPYRALCARVARAAAVGVPTLGAGKGEDSDSETDDEDNASHLVIEVVWFVVSFFADLLTYLLTYLLTMMFV